MMAFYFSYAELVPSANDCLTLESWRLFYERDGRFVDPKPTVRVNRRTGEAIQWVHKDAPDCILGGNRAATFRLCPGRSSNQYKINVNVHPDCQRLIEPVAKDVANELNCSILFASDSLARIETTLSQLETEIVQLTTKEKGTVVVKISYTAMNYGEGQVFFNHIDIVARNYRMGLDFCNSNDVLEILPHALDYDLPE